MSLVLTNDFLTKHLFDQKYSNSNKRLKMWNII